MVGGGGSTTMMGLATSVDLPRTTATAGAPITGRTGGGSMRGSGMGTTPSAAAGLP